MATTRTTLAAVAIRRDECGRIPGVREPRRGGVSTLAQRWVSDRRLVEKESPSARRRREAYRRKDGAVRFRREALHLETRLCIWGRGVIAASRPRVLSYHRAVGG